MVEISGEMVRRLRERTGAGLMECKRALEQAGGNEEVAVDNLRKAGLKTAEKKAGREMGEGRVAAWTAPGGKAGALVALTCETDFVARTADFENLLSGAAKLAAESNCSDAAALSGMAFGGSTLGFPGPGVAVKANDAGISSARVNGFYKVDEAADNFDWNGDGDKLDLVVRQSQLSIGSSRGMGTASGVANAEAADYGGSPNGPSVAMFLTDEAMAGGDLNGDDDATDLVVRWFRFD